MRAIAPLLLVKFHHLESNLDDDRAAFSPVDAHGNRVGDRFETVMRRSQRGLHVGVFVIIIVFIRIEIVVVRIVFRDGGDTL